MILAANMCALNAQLVINEVSQGPSGNKEYVELLVIGTPVCGGSNTVDLRGWIIDDNNSWHGVGSGTGIAAGHVRFANISQWANVKIGTLILIYNDADKSPATTALTADSTDANSDCVYILPIGSSLLDKNTTLPANAGSMTTYNVAGTPYSAAGTFGALSMANGGDAFHTVSPANYTAAYHSIGWGTANLALTVYFTSNQGGNVIYMANTVDNDPFNSANYVDISATTNETPGAANNAANAAWIAALNNNCLPFTAPTVSINTPAALTCTSTYVVLTAVTNTLGATYTWSADLANTNTDTVGAAGNYSVTITDAGGACTASASVVVNQDIVAPSVTINSPGAVNCNGSPDTIIATSTTAGATFTWQDNSTLPQLIITSSGTYSVTVTNPVNGCTSSSSVTVNPSVGLTLQLSKTDATCGENNGTATVTLTTGNASSYLWNNNQATASLINLAPGTYSVSVTGDAGCNGTASITINSASTTPAIITANKTNLCNGDTAFICAPNLFSAYVWNTGETSACITTTLGGNYYVTVTENGNCTSTSNPIAIKVKPIPTASVYVTGDSLIAYNAVSYQWYFDNSPIQGATNAVYVANTIGNYAVLITDTNGCTALSNPITITTTGLSDFEAELGLSVYPNPNQTGIWNIITTDKLLAATIRVYDAKGSLVFADKISNNTTVLNLNISAGVYVLHLENELNAVTRKLIRTE